MQEKSKKTSTATSTKTQARPRKTVNTSRTVTKTGATSDPVGLTMPSTDELTAEPEVKRTTKKSTTRIITKNGELSSDTAATIDTSVIDSSVFDDDVTEEPIAGYYHKSMTIEIGRASCRERVSHQV